MHNTKGKRLPNRCLCERHLWTLSTASVWRKSGKARDGFSSDRPYNKAEHLGSEAYAALGLYITALSGTRSVHRCLPGSGTVYRCPIGHRERPSLPYPAPERPSLPYPAPERPSLTYYGLLSCCTKGIQGERLGQGFSW